MASFYAVPKSRKSVDNVRVAETHLFSEGGILELKPQMKHSFVSVPDGACSVSAACRFLFCCIMKPASDLLLEWSYLTATFRTDHCILKDSVSLMCSVHLVMCRQENVCSLNTSVSHLKVPDYRFGLSGAIFFDFFYLRYNI